ncbi:MAG: hypothetical protein OXI67_14020 [Candidatus Poribacteria bacterium]|nr:hypothetical protein [Candidatus Poribacteria bacterium]
MNIQLKIVAFVLLLTFSVIVGCAQKLTEEQALAESQAISDFIYNYSVARQQAHEKMIQGKNLPVNTTINPISLPPIKKVGNRDKRLVLLSPRASLRWLRAYGFKVNITSYAEMISLRKGNSYGRSYSSPPRRKYSKVDDPQYLQIGNSRIEITGFTRWGDVIWINDQFGNIRVLTYE